jgi:predicted MFS family arabinose efflux permease
VLFVWRERRAPEPIMPMLLFRNRVFVLATLATACSFMSVQGSSLYFPLLFQVVYGVQMANSGWLTAPMMVGIVISARINGRVMFKTGRYKPMQIAGLICGVAAYASLTLVTATGQPVWAIVCCIFAIGLCFGLVNPNMVVAVQNAVPPEHVGAATASTSFFRSLGGVTGVAACGAILTSRLASQLAATPLPDGADLLKGGIVQILALPPDAYAVVVEIYRNAITSAFALGVVTTILALGFAIAMPERTLKSGLPTQSERAQSRRFGKS